jgi:MFS family permease
VLPLAGIGPALFLHGLVWQNLGWQAVLGGQPPARAFLLVMLANLAGLAAGVAAAGARGDRAGWRVVATASVGLVVAALLAERATVAACFLGQASAATVLVAVVRRATPSSRAAGRSLAAVSAAWALGMLLFVLLVFLYYAAYDMRLPFGNWLVLPVAAAMVALAGIGAGWPGPNSPGHPLGFPGPLRTPAPTWPGPTAERPVGLTGCRCGSGSRCCSPRSPSGRRRRRRSRRPGRRRRCG